MGIDDIVINTEKISIIDTYSANVSRRFAQQIDENKKDFVCHLTRIVIGSVNDVNLILLKGQFNEFSRVQRIELFGVSNRYFPSELLGAMFVSEYQEFQKYNDAENKKKLHFKYYNYHHIYGCEIYIEQPHDVVLALTKMLIAEIPKELLKGVTSYNLD